MNNFQKETTIDKNKDLSLEMQIQFRSMEREIKEMHEEIKAYKQKTIATRLLLIAFTMLSVIMVLNQIRYLL